MKETQNNSRVEYKPSKLSFPQPLSYGALDLIKHQDKKEVNQFNKRYGSLLASF